MEKLRSIDIFGQRSPFIIARVTSLVTGPTKPGTKEIDYDYTGPTDIGKIRYQLLYQGTRGVRTKKIPNYENEPAYPMSSFLKQYPSINEIVLLVSGPSPDLNENSEAKRLFYFPFSYALWNDANHNGFPDLEDYAAYIKNSDNVPEYSGVATKGAPLPIGYTLVEKQEKFVRNLQPFEGDSILQSRFGQSIRFGSTVPLMKDKNTWSNYGEPGAPITIISNEQRDRIGLKPFDNTIENINLDGSSIYLTSTQLIDIPAILQFPIDSFNTSINPVTDDVIKRLNVPISNKYTSANQQDSNSNSINSSGNSQSVDQNNASSSSQKSTGTNIYTSFGRKKTQTLVNAKRFFVEIGVTDQKGTRIVVKNYNSKSSYQEAYSKVVQLLDDYKKQNNIEFSIAKLDSLVEED